MSRFKIKLKSARANTQQFKLKLLKLIVYILQIKKKMLGAYSGLIDVFVYWYDEQARNAFFTYARFIIKITSTPKQHEVDPRTFWVE